MMPLSATELLSLKTALLQLPLFDIHKLLFIANWKKIARKEQFCGGDADWNTWLVLAGRGYGKTRMGSQWICEKAILNPNSICAVIAPTHTLLLETNFNGPAGILTLLPKELVESYVQSPLPTVTLKNGSQIKGYSAQEPERLRGPNWHFALLDEFAAWQYMQMSLDMIRMCLRIGTHPQMMITTTPKPFPLLRRIMAEEGVRITRGTTYDNRANLAPTFFKELEKYAGTQIGKQELLGELLDFAESGIFKRSWLNIWPNYEVGKDGLPNRAKKKPFPKLHYILQSYDTAFKIKQANDPSAGTTWGVFQPYRDAKLHEIPKGHHSHEYAVMLLDCWSERLAYPDLRKKLKTEYESTFTDEIKKVDIVLIEDKASGQALIPDLQMAGIPVEAYTLPPDADKIQRAHAVSHLAKRYIWLPESMKRGREGTPRDWALPFVDQVTIFGPEAFREMEKMRRKAVQGEAILNEATDDITAHDDYVDTLTQMLAWLRDSQWLRLPEDDAGRETVPQEAQEQSRTKEGVYG